ncbi:hypothetical protein TSAR_004881 [Trichomalopsis sarcophagae]|uniref:F-box domain-containing protein n=1 Tax=Trichomalopsis sarcophagae TaxID=543379 RepID=A0A232F5C1_9HYME|nr:hypothetical protein TSAR_004881 [Trichomalopsis sarcophagae]
MENSSSISKKARLAAALLNNKASANNKIVIDELNGEYVLQDLMNNVCQYLNMYDLCHVAQVCKSWNIEVDRELERRLHHHFMVLPYLHSKELSDPSFHVSKILNNKPKVTILFPGTNHDVDDIQLEYDTYQTYRKQFPNNLIVVGAFEATMNTDVIHSCPLLIGSKIMDGYSPAGTLSLSLPMHEELSIKQSCIFESAYLLKGKDIINDMILELQPTNSNTKSTLIILAANHDESLDENEMTTLEKLIKSSFRPNSYTLWGFATSDRLFASSPHEKRNKNVTENETRMVGLNLSGPNFKSWSTVISTHSTKNEFIERLTNFKYRIQLKKNSIGLVTAPVIDHDDDDNDDDNNGGFMEDIKKIFPEIPFLGAFGKEDDYYFGIDPMSNNESKDIIGIDIISILICTYE